jgi:hypothetical protein
MERSPVSIEIARGKEIDAVYEFLKSLPNESIYDAGRMAQPDEVANYGRGDGAEKAFFLANVLKERGPHEEVEVIIDGARAVVRNRKEYYFESTKGLQQSVKVGESMQAAEAP